MPSNRAFLDPNISSNLPNTSSLQLVAKEPSPEPWQLLSSPLSEHHILHHGPKILTIYLAGAYR